MTTTKDVVKGGAFLIDDSQPSDVFTPERFDDEQLMAGRTCADFVEREVGPRMEEIEAGNHETTVELLRAAGELGLLGADVPEAYGGLGLDKVTTTLITEKLARAASFAVSFGAHVGIGTLPIVFYGNEDQKARYLPDLASGKKHAAYALTEPDAGSDATGGKASARLSDDGRFYLLNGEKQWITNSGFADVFIVYAKVDGERMTAFIVERGFMGLTVGPEFQKMGLHGSSTCSVFMDDVPVPVENVLGEVGKGHLIAFNILNIGRWKLAAGCVGSAKALIETSALYAAERKQFGRPIASFPAIQQKLAQMAARTFALESVVYRTAGLFDGALAASDPGDPEGAAQAIREYAVEASINKVLGSEVLDFVADESLQIHGGYGYIRGSDVERAYRDARINRIFEGTNEINRMLIPGTLLRRAMKGELPLTKAIQRVQQELTSLPTAEAGADGGAMAAEVAQLANLKRATLMLAGIGIQKYLMRVEEEQEFLLSVADLVILTYAWESALLRTRQMVERGGPEVDAAVDLTLLFGDWAAETAESTARRALAGMEEGDALQAQLGLVRRLFRRTPANTVQVGRRIAQRVLEARGYPAFGTPGGAA